MNSKKKFRCFDLQLLTNWAMILKRKKYYNFAYVNDF